MIDRMNRSGGFPVIHLFVLVLVTILEVVYYPHIAEAIYALTGGQGGPGSSIGYFRDTYVLAGAIGFVVLASLGLWMLSRSNRANLVAVVAWVLNAVLLVASSLWYFHAVRAASDYRG